MSEDEQLKNETEDQSPELAVNHEQIPALWADKEQLIQPVAWQAEEDPFAEPVALYTDEEPVYESFAQQADEQTFGQDANAQEDIENPLLARHFEPIPPKVLARAKRTKRILITFIIILALVLFGGVGGGVYYYLEYIHDPTTLTQEVLAIDAIEDTIEDRGVTEPIDMPNLAQMFGRTPEEVVALLGPDYAITKTDTESSSTAASTEATDGEADSVTTQVVTISYMPEEQDASAGLRQVQKIYLSLNASGTVIEVYFISSMDLLGYPISSFSRLIATQDSFTASLISAGVVPASDVVYVVPSIEDFTEYVDHEASVKKITKETATWEGAVASEVAPRYFEIKYTYDYGASGVEDTPDRHPAQRMLHIKLS